MPARVVEAPIRVPPTIGIHSPEQQGVPTHCRQGDAAAAAPFDTRTAPARDADSVVNIGPDRMIGRQILTVADRGARFATGAAPDPLTAPERVLASAAGQTCIEGVR